MYVQGCSLEHCLKRLKKNLNIQEQGRGKIIVHLEPVFLLGANFYIKPRGRKHIVELVRRFSEKVWQFSPKLLVLKH